MFDKLVKSVFGSSNDRYVKSLGKIVDKINALEPMIQELSDEALKAQTDKFRKALDEGSTLDDILPEAFATVREASKRVFRRWVQRRSTSANAGSARRWPQPGSRLASQACHLSAFAPASTVRMPASRAALATTGAAAR